MRNRLISTDSKTHEVEGLDVLFEDRQVCPRNLAVARRFSFVGSSSIPNLDSGLRLKSNDSLCNLHPGDEQLC